MAGPSLPIGQVRSGFVKLAADLQCSHALLPYLYRDQVHRADSAGCVRHGSTRHGRQFGSRTGFARHCHHWHQIGQGRNPAGALPAGASFPDCKSKVVRTASLTIAGGIARATLTGLAPGRYAISVFHDANANAKLDTFAGIPKEGYGFSRNPSFKPRAPKFAEAEIAVSGAVSTTITLRYIF